MEASLERSADLTHRRPHTLRPLEANQGAARNGGPFYDVERIRGAAAVLDEITRLQISGMATTCFQSKQWLAVLFSVVAPSFEAEPNLLVLRNGSSGAVAVALPLIVRKIGAVRYAEFADLGLSDYCAPLIGAEPPATHEEAAALLATVRAALDDVDIIRFEKMPTVIEGSFNPLLLSKGAMPSRFVGNQLTIATTVKDFIASRGKKYRKEAERSRRRLEDAGAVTFTRVTSIEEIDQTYGQLEAWQSARHLDLGHDYWLDRREVSAFYRDLIVENRSGDFASLFALKVDAQIVAIILGITKGRTFTLLRIADAGEDWRHCSPGRMAVLEAMHQLMAEGITTYDMGIGDYPFKRWIGCEPYPLYDRAIAVSPRGWVYVVADSLKRHLRANAMALAIVRRIKYLGGKRPQHQPPD